LLCKLEAQFPVNEGGGPAPGCERHSFIIGIEEVVELHEAYPQTFGHVDFGQSLRFMA
jgi:hypothetical protein